MALGNFDAQGIWQHGEDDSYATFSERLNKGQKSVSDRLAGAASLRNVFLRMDGPGAGWSGAAANNATTNLFTGTRLAAETRNVFVAVNRTTGVVTVPVTGDYRITQGVALDAAANFQLGTASSTDINTGSVFNTPSLGTQRYAGGIRTIRLTAGTQLRFLLFQASGAARSLPNTKPDSTATFWEIELVR